MENSSGFRSPVSCFPSFPLGRLLYLKSEGQDKDMLKILLESDEDLK